MPLAHEVPGPLAGGAVAAPCRPPRKAMGASMRAGPEAWRSNALFAAGSSKFHRTLRCARDPCPADGLAPPGCARPRRQPLVRLAPGSIRDRSCRTSRLSTPRARGPVLAAGARKRDGHDQCTRNMKLKRGGEAIAEPTPLARTVPGPLAGGAVAAPCRPPRKATGASLGAPRERRKCLATPPAPQGDGCQYAGVSGTSQAPCRRAR
jgi:hypothetical protein